MVEDEYIPLMVEVQEERFDKVERDPGGSCQPSCILHANVGDPRIAHSSDTLNNVMRRAAGPGERIGAKYQEHVLEC